MSSEKNKNPLDGMVRPDSVALMLGVYRKFAGEVSDPVAQQIGLSLLKDIIIRADSELDEMRKAARMNLKVADTDAFFKGTALRPICDQVQPTLEALGMSNHTATELGREVRSSYLGRVMGIVGGG
ncbi:MAG: hypothetical protein SFX19_05780 [Alphaproteobacteria bacterium]|nr:hypothetical protein [Alphaproteobacteria bacterium]